MAHFTPFNLSRPPVQTVPVILTSPHSGRHYHPEFLAMSRLDRLTIRRSEDCFVDELFSAAPALGMPLLAANFPRAYCDVNREPWELDPSMFADKLPSYVNTTSARVQAGLGTIARVVGANEAIYRDRLYFAEAESRIATCWQPFHAALKMLIEETLGQFGVCLLIDCHSMPSMPGRAGQKAQVILGDGHGASCSGTITAFTQSAFGDSGLEVRRNDPYAGGYITHHYGKPIANVHALQVEVARALYMNEKNVCKSANFPAMRDIISQFLESLADRAIEILGAGPALSAAAE